MTIVTFDLIREYFNEEKDLKDLKYIFQYDYVDHKSKYVSVILTKWSYCYLVPGFILARYKAIDYCIVLSSGQSMQCMQLTILSRTISGDTLSIVRRCNVKERLKGNRP